jgi:hypothetical protein
MPHPEAHGLSSRIQVWFSSRYALHQPSGCYPTGPRCRPCHWHPPSPEPSLWWYLPLNIVAPASFFEINCTLHAFGEHPISTGNQTHLFRKQGIRHIRQASSLAFGSTYLRMSNLALLTSSDSLFEVVSCPEPSNTHTVSIALTLLSTYHFSFVPISRYHRHLFHHYRSSYADQPGSFSGLDTS